VANPVTVDIPYTPYPQQASLLCWAASTQIVADALGQTIDQATIAAYAWLPATGSPAIVAAFNAKVAMCKKNIAQYCNLAYLPILDELGITCLHGSALNPPCLSPDQIKADINNGRPIIFGWQYGKSSGSGVHFMVIVGYRITAAQVFQLDIYDPLPVNVGNPQTISYDNYTVTAPKNLHNDMGVPYELLDSYYNVHLASQTVPVVPAPPTGLTVDGQPAMAPAPPPAAAMRETPLIDPRAAVEASRAAASAEVARRTSQGGPPLSLGEPMAIVAAGLDDLRSTNPEAVLGLLGRGSGTVLYPVESAGRVRDSFLIIRHRDQWFQGGYANTTVTRLLAEERYRRAPTPVQRAEHYLFSVPALGAFFLGHGSGADATLIPISDDHSIKVDGRHLQANDPYRADQLLPALSAAAARFEPFRDGDGRKLR
jgi:Papain-like cysteine protease AvrRpt2